MAMIEERGIDAQYFWNHLYFDRMPDGHEESRDTNPIELLTSNAGLSLDLSLKLSVFSEGDRQRG